MGKPSKRLAAQVKQQRKKAARKAAKAFASATLEIPAVTEDDLLAFQLAHFGDDSKPQDWFVDRDTALNCQLQAYEEEDDLGYYDDGVKRTLTDEQIAMFRHSEEQELLRQERLRQQAQEEEDDEEYLPAGHLDSMIERQQSPASVSSLESELMDLVVPRQRKAPSCSPPPPPAPSVLAPVRKQRSPSSRSDTSRSTGPIQRRRRQEIPYDQRHKRKWEQYIDGEDPVEGSITHRRILRQLDEQPAEESVDMDY